MASETSQMELDLLQRRAELVGMYVNRHRQWDPLTDSGGDLYLMERKTRRNPKPPSMLRYATAEQINDALAIIERETFKRRA